MSTVISDVLYITGSYVLLGVALLFTLNWLTKGFLWAFVRVRASRGAKILMCMHAVNDRYYAVGKFEENSLLYKNRAKKSCRFEGVTPDSIYNTMGVQGIDIDEINSGIWTKQGAFAQGNDPVHVDNIIVRALQNPLNQSTLIKILVAFLIIFLLYAFVQGFLTYQLFQEMARITTLTGVVV